MNMSKVKAMIESAFTKRDAMNMLETWKIYKGLSEVDYQKGRELIRKQFDKNKRSESFEDFCEFKNEL